MELIFEKSVAGRRGVRLRVRDDLPKPKFDAKLLRAAPADGGRGKPEDE